MKSALQLLNETAFEKWYATSGLQDYYIGVEEMNDVFLAGAEWMRGEAARVTLDQIEARSSPLWDKACSSCYDAILALKGKP